jgi:pyruvate dehydrogenase E2 component (dihydrolipoamide acetyltransferase)
MKMVYEFRFPDVGEGIHEGEIVEWKVKEGERISKDQVIALIETDKAVVEVPSPRSGIVSKLNFKEGEKIRVGEVLLTIAEDGEKISQKQVAAKQKETPLQKIAANKAAEKPPETKTEKKKDAGGVVGKIETGSSVLAPSKEGTGGKKIAAETDEALALPKTRKLAEELGVDLSKLRGSGEGRRITDDDVKAFAEHVPVAGTPSNAPKVSFDAFGRTLEIPMSATRKRIAEKMSLSFSKIPHAVEMVEVDVTELNEVRRREKEVAENKGFGLTYLPFIVRAVVAALEKNPYLNSSYDEEKQEIVLKQYYNIGIAVETPHGLMVPVVKRCNEKSILKIAEEINKLAILARSREIKLEDLQGGTFTITNYGSIGGTFGVPIINHPEVAILGVGRIQEKPVVTGQGITGHKIEIRKMLPLSLSFDHRVIDGAQAAQFIADLTKLLEDPSLFMIGID